MFKTRTMLFAGALAAGLTAGALASDNTVNDQLKALRAELDAVRATNSQLQGEVAKLRSASDENWLNERRTEEVKSLVKEVLADADTRASLLEGGMSAGHNGKEFFLASEDGSFKMVLGGQLQFRHIWVHQDEASAPDEDDAGFQFRRMKLKAKGHVGNPKIKYELVFAGDRDSGAVEIEDAKMGYSFGGGWAVNFGKFKIPFLREELTSSSKQLAVDRSLVTEWFTLDRSEQVELTYGTDTFNFAFSINDGADEEFSTIGTDDAEIAVAARVDFALQGKLKQAGDFTTWSKDETGIFIGGAVFFQAGDDDNNNAGSNNGFGNYTSWTIDGSIETNGFSIFAAYMGANMDFDSSTATDLDPMGLLVQAAYQIIPDTLEPYVRWELIDSDVQGDEELQAFTFGLNWYIRKHDAKFTTDVVWVYEGDLSSNAWGNSHFGDGLGFAGVSNAVNDDIFVWRAQFQLLF